MLDEHGEAFLKKVIVFCDELRKEDIVVTPSELIDAARSLEFIDLLDYESFRDGLKTAILKKYDSYERFDLLFRRFWIDRTGKNLASPLAQFATKPSATRQGTEQESNFSKSANTDIPKSSPLRMLMSDTKSEPSSKDVLRYSVYSSAETEGKKEFGKSTLAEKAILKRTLRSFARRMATRPGRRFDFSKRNGEIDFRRTMRSSLKSGHVSNIFLKENRISKSDLLILADISGSMDSYSGRLLKIIYYAANSIPQTKIFGFSTRLVALNRFIQGRAFKESLRLISENVRIWSSGTRIGSALEQLVSLHSDCLRPSTVLVIMSDGWEIGDLETLQLKLKQIRKRVARIVWLNPHADTPGYQPEVAGIKSAMPYIDILCGFGVLENKRKLESAFGKTIRPLVYSKKKTRAH